MKKIDYKRIFIIFMLVSIVGSVYESFYNLIFNGGFVLNRDLIYGVFSSLYGFIFTFIFLMVYRIRSNVKMFLVSSILSGGLEYMASFILDKWFKIEFWNYENLFLNINGRTTIPYMLFWGLFITLFIKVLYPIIDKLIKKIDGIIFRSIIILISVFMLFNIIISYGAFIRMLERKEDNNQYNKIDMFFDKYYSDDVMIMNFPILKDKI